MVDDVNADDRYLACFVSTRSEIVVPITYGERVVGEIDIDSDTPAAFGAADRAFLERVATLVSRHAANARGRLPGAPDSARDLGGADEDALTEHDGGELVRLPDQRLAVSRQRSPGHEERGTGRTRPFGHVRELAS